MTLRRVVALAQALTMIILLAPGPLPVGPSSVQAAPAPAEPSAVNIFDAEGNGIGCGGKKYKGPKVPKDPPWPPGAKPTPSPSPEPSADAGDAVSVPIESEEPQASGPTAFVAATGVRLAQADPQPTPTPEPAAAEEPLVDVTPEPAPKVRRSKLLKGIDVSRWQNGVNYDVVKEDGNRFVIMKATESTELEDPWLATNLANARREGLVVGAYHVFDYTVDGTRQANHFIDRLEEVDGIDGALPPVIDVECWTYRGQSNQAISATRLRDVVERVYQRTGRMPMIYTSVYMWSQVVGNATGFEDTPLWAACWRCESPPSIPATWDDWDFWQIGTFKIPGAAPEAASPNRIDGNYFRGKNKDLKALRLRPFRVAAGDVATGGGSVEVDLGGRDAVHIRTSPDGESWGDWTRIRGTPTAEIPTEEGTHTVYAQLRNGPGLRSPVVSDTVLVDATPPEVSAPTVSLREGTIDEERGTIPVAVRWQARDATAGLGDAAVQVACGQDRNRRDEAPGSAAPGEQVDWQGESRLFTQGACDVTAVAIDGAGNRNRARTDGVAARIIAGDRADISADEVGVIARRGPDLGRAAIEIDGQAVGLVDLYAPEPTGPEIVYVAETGGSDISIAAMATGTSDPAATGDAVAIEGFVSLSFAG